MKKTKIIKDEKKLEEFRKDMNDNFPEELVEKLVKAIYKKF